MKKNNRESHKRDIGTFRITNSKGNHKKSRLNVKGEQLVTYRICYIEKTIVVLLLETGKQELLNGIVFHGIDLIAAPKIFKRINTIFCFFLFKILFHPTY